MTDNVLLLYSGGFDSTACLVKLLKETDYNLDVLRLKTSDNNLEILESEGSQKIIEYLKESEDYRFFEYHTTKIRSNVVNMYIARSELAKWYNNIYETRGKKYKYVVIGRNIDDDQNESLNAAFPNADDKFYKPLHPDLKSYTKFYYPIMDMNKVQVIKTIPSKLYIYVATCRMPLLKRKTHNNNWHNWYQPCSKCYSCFQIKKAIVKDADLQKYPSLLRHCKLH